MVVSSFAVGLLGALIGGYVVHLTYSFSLVQECTVQSFETADLIWDLYRRIPDEFVNWLVLAAILVSVSCLIGLFRVMRFFLAIVTCFTKYCWRRVRWDFMGITRYYQPEKFVEGSNYIPINKPSFQADVIDDGGIVRGQCFRMDNYLVTATHVLQGLNRVTVANGDKFIECDTQKFEDLSMDVSVLLCSPNDLSTLGMSKCKIPNTCVEGRVYTSVCAGGRGTHGAIRAIETMGYIVYDASTTGGFSGAPYWSGNYVYGMHLGSHGANIGVDCLFINALLNREDSEDWAYEEIAKIAAFGKKTKAVRSAYNPDEVRVKVGGKFFTLDCGLDETLLEYLDFDQQVSYKPESDNVDIPQFNDNQTVIPNNVQENSRRFVNAEVSRGNRQGDVSVKKDVRKQLPSKSMKRSQKLRARVAAMKLENEQLKRLSATAGQE